MFRLRQRERIEGRTLQKKNKKGPKKTLDGLVSGNVVGTVPGYILELEMPPESHCESLWTPWVAILASFWMVGKITPKQARRQIQGVACQGTFGPLKNTQTYRTPKNNSAGAQGHVGGLVIYV